MSILRVALALLLLAAGCTDSQPVAPPTRPAPPPAPAPAPAPTPEPEPPTISEPPGCDGERQRAQGYLDAILPGEWDGTPFRFYLFDDFPEAAGDGYLEGQLEEVRHLADSITAQLGYPIIEVGGAIPVRENMPEGWNAPTLFGPKGCEQWRERGEILGINHTATPPNHAGGGASYATPRCAVFSYFLTDGPAMDFPTYARTAVVHEVFHLFGFKHSDDQARKESQGIFMSEQLTRGRDGDRAQYPTSDDIDALRCVFPDPDHPR